MGDVNTTVPPRVLTICGERKEERGGYLVRELRSGSFRRSMQPPEGIGEEKIKLRFEEGVLEVTLEGAAARESRHIQ